MRAAYLHGLNSLPNSEKTDLLKETFDYVYVPLLDYTDPDLFEQILQEVKIQQIDLLIGSSLGGWFAYCISTLTGIPTLLFNPAVQGRLIEPMVRKKTDLSTHTVVFGKNDEVIIPQKTVDWFKANQADQIEFNWEFCGHRVPLKSFEKWIKHMAEPVDK